MPLASLRFGIRVVMCTVCIAGCDPSGPIREEASVDPPGLTTLSTASSSTLARVVSYSANVRVEATSVNGKRIKSDRRISVRHGEDGIVADIFVLAPSDTASRAEALGRSYRIAWTSTGEVLSVDDRGRRLEGEFRTSFESDKHLRNATNSPETKSVATTLLNKIASSKEPSGVGAVRMGRGHLISFQSDEDLLSTRTKLAQTFGPGRVDGEHIEFSGLTPAGTVTVRIRRSNSLLEFVRVEKAERGRVESRFEYAQVGDGLFARTRSVVRTDRPGFATQEFSMTLENLLVTEAK